MSCASVVDRGVGWDVGGCVGIFGVNTAVSVPTRSRRE